MCQLLKTIKVKSHKYNAVRSCDRNWLASGSSLNINSQVEFEISKI